MVLKITIVATMASSTTVPTTAAFFVFCGCHKFWGSRSIDAFEFDGVHVDPGFARRPRGGK